MNRTLTTGLSVGVLGLGVVFAGANPAVAADLPALTVNPSPVDTAGAFDVSGTQCTDGTTPGAATVFIVYPDGHDEMAGTYEADADGNWTASFSPNDSGAVPAGTYTLKVTCDIYETQLTYPDKQFNANDTILDPAASATDTTVVPGGETTVNVVGFPAEVGLSLTLVSKADPTSQITLATGTSDLNGAASLAVTIPASTALGTYTLVVNGADGTSVAVDITVVSPSAAPRPITGPELANTGASVGGLSVLAGSLLAFGGAALYAGRRKDS